MQECALFVNLLFCLMPSLLFQVPHKYQKTDWIRIWRPAHLNTGSLPSRPSTDINTPPLRPQLPQVLRLGVITADKHLRLIITLASDLQHNRGMNHPRCSLWRFLSQVFVSYSFCTPMRWSKWTLIWSVCAPSYVWTMTQLIFIQSMFNIVFVQVSLSKIHPELYYIN